MMGEYRINVYEDDYREKVIARVRYNTNLDFWDGREYNAGSMGYHKGITKLRDGRYVIIHGSQWQGSVDYGVIVSEEEALQEILKTGNSQLLKTKKFKGLNELYKKQMVEEEEDELIEEEV